MHNLSSLASLLEPFQIFNRIKFYQTGHKYEVDNKSAPLSVTRLINLFSPVFERDKIAKNVARSSKRDINDVLHEWELNKNIACAKGTIFHSFVDSYLANQQASSDFTESDALILNPVERMSFRETIDKLKNQFYSFYDTEYKDKFIHLKSEFVVGDVDDTRICGTIDNLSINKSTGNLAIIDYKTNKKIDTDNSYGKTFIPPLDHIKHCKHTTYSLQIGIYKYILEKYTPYKIDTYQIVWFNENNNDYKVIDALNLDGDVETMFNCYSSYYNDLVNNIDSLNFDID
jgi:hypothetical protein